MTQRTVNRRDLAKLAAGGAALAAVGGSLAVSPAMAAALAQDAPAGDLVYGKSEEAVGFDPAVVTASSSFDLIAVVYEQLVQFDENGEPQPMLAEKWGVVEGGAAEASPAADGATPVAGGPRYVFTLREGVTFHNGQPLTANDVKFTFDRIKNPDTGSAWTSQFDPVASIDVVDDRTVAFNLSEPYGPFLATLSSNYAAIVPADESIDLQTTMVGTGAFKMQEYTKDTQTILAANADYYEDGVPKLATVTHKILPDESARVAAIRTGEIQLTTLVDPVSVESASGSEGVQIIEQDTADYYLLGLNCKVAPFDDVKVRQALSMAIDRQAIIDSVFFGKGQVTGPVVPTLGDWAVPVDQLPNYAVDTDAAKALLEEAGQGGLSFKITVGADRTEFVNIALVIQDQLKDIGVTVELDQVEWGTFIEKWKARDFQSFVSYNGSGNDPDRALYPALYTGGSVNAFQFSDPKVDELLDKGRTLSDREERKPVYQELEGVIAEQAPLIFISTRVGQFAARDTVQGFAPTALDTWSTLEDTTVSQ
ncbi:MAG TPA: ABC transporter substrate-binding protein [Thermomicrobiales bacterium]|nr:ABC transporter substrate-binding protein [Thermomicrobiales bacterium]